MSVALRPLSVLHVIESLSLGGAEACLVSGLPALAERGVRASVLPLDGPLDLAGPLRSRGVEVLPVARAGWGAARRAVLASDLVHTHLFKANVAGRLLALTARRPSITSLHNPDYGHEGPGRLGLRLALDRLSAGLALPTFIAVSDVVRQDFEQHLRRSSVVIPNPVALDWLEPDLDAAEARRSLGLDDRPVVFTCARLHRQKGLDVLSDVAARRPGVQFVVAGLGPDRADLAARGALRLLGGIDRPTMARWLAAADAAALPSRWESFGVAAVEQLGAGLPLVVSDIPGLGDTVGEAALRVPPGDVRALGDAIDRLLGDAELRGRLAGLGRARARAFGPGPWAGRVAELYREVLAGR
ncbi:MAG: glycosyltransferase family 1 protein [Myxococcales bacterium]|nr:MAG: glycosyltransferase family 1 protein [Myxococcales bacterium]